MPETIDKKGLIEDGRRAREAGHSHRVCPYSPSDASYGYWMAGWEKRQARDLRAEQTRRVCQVLADGNTMRLPTGSEFDDELLEFLNELIEAKIAFAISYNPTNDMLELTVDNTVSRSWVVETAGGYGVYVESDCERCDELIDNCTCDRCDDCDELIDDCTCDRCDYCGELIDDCTCDRCETCNHRASECTCPRCQECDERLDDCDCARCPMCNEREHDCLCNEEDDEEDDEDSYAYEDDDEDDDDEEDDYPEDEDEE